jgi:Zn-dependent protease with chaperone function
VNFFEHQAAARRRSLRLMWMLAVAVACIVALVDVGVLLTAGLGGDAPWRLLVPASLVTLAVIAIAALWRLSRLRDGGAAIALSMGAREVDAVPADVAQRRLRNVVEEIAIASGVPMPRLFVLDQEDGINAFAAGYAPTDAAITVTAGAIGQLNRDELQGVIAHEFSHILNGDMRLNVRMIGLLFGITVLAEGGRRLLQVRGRGRQGLGIAVLAALALLVAGSVGLFFARLIKAAISRQREFLADASAVQFTRQTSGLAGALKKIAGVPAGSRLAHVAQAEEVSHMLFGEGLAGLNWFATHPPLLARIRVLEPGFAEGGLRALRGRWLQQVPDGLAEDLALGLAPRTTPLPDATSHVQLQPAQVVAQVAKPNLDDLAEAGGLRGAIDPQLHALVLQPQAVQAVILALLLRGTPERVAAQRERIAQRLGAPVAGQAIRVHRVWVQALHPLLRLPLVSLGFPALRQQTLAALKAFSVTVDALIHAEGEITTFAYCLGWLVRVQLREASLPRQARSHGALALSSVRAECVLLLATLAHAGHDNPIHAHRAFRAGTEALLGGAPPPYRPPAAGLHALDAVWPRLDDLAPAGKQQLVAALVQVIGEDGRMTVGEAELLRVVCAILHCPLPPRLSPTIA